MLIGIGILIMAFFLVSVFGVYLDLAELGGCCFEGLPQNVVPSWYNILGVWSFLLRSTMR